MMKTLGIVFNYDRKDILYGLKFFLYFFAIIFINRYSSILSWSIYIFAPLLFWGYNIKKKVQQQPLIMDTMYTHYMVFTLLIIITALFSPYSIFIPLTRFCSAIVLFVFLKLSFADIQSKKDVLLVFDATTIVGLFVVAYLFANHFNGFVFIFDGLESNWGNKNSAGNYLFFSFVLSVLRSQISQNIKYFFTFGTIFLICLIMTLSLKVILGGVIIYGAFIVANRKKIPMIVKFAAVVLVFIAVPTIVISLESLVEDSMEFRNLYNRLPIIFGSNDISGETFVDEREYLMDRTIKLFYSSPLYGIGLENSRVVYDTYSHNTYVEILAGGGICLIIPFVLFMITIGLYLINRKDFSGFLILIFLCIVYISNALRIYDDTRYMFLLFALVKCKQYMSDNKFEIVK